MIQLVIAEYERSIPPASHLPDGSYGHITNCHRGQYDCEVKVIRGGKQIMKKSYSRNDLDTHLRNLWALRNGGLTLKKVLIADKHHSKVRASIAALNDEMVIDVEKLPRK